MSIRDDPSLQWPKPISTPIEKRDKSKCGSFHQDHGHYINECRRLKDQVETLIWQWKLQKYVRKRNEQHPFMAPSNEDAKEGRA